LSETEIASKNKNIVGRAMVGGMLFGAMGALIGGMSETGTNSMGKTNYYLI
jgi:hypothetical protein